MPTPTNSKLSITPSATPVCDTWVGPPNEIPMKRHLEKTQHSQSSGKSNKRLIARPKSTPAGLRVRFSSTGNDEPSRLRRPKTAAVMTGQECERVTQVEAEPTRRQALEPHLSARRNRPPPWQKELDPPMVPAQIGPGFLLSRSKAKVNVTIQSEEFFDQVAEQRKPVKGDPERDALIKQLQDQVSEMQFLLEEETLAHRLTQQRADEVLTERLQNKQHEHDALLEQLQLEHQQQCAEQKDTHEQELDSLKSMYEQQLEKSRQDLELVQGAFQTYKTQLHIDFDERWKRTQEELRKAFDLEKQEAIEEERQVVARQKAIERAQLVKDQNVKLLNRDKEHKREIEAVTRRFASASSEIKELQDRVRDLKEVEDLHTELKQRYDHLTSKHAETEHTLADTRLQLHEFQQTFESRVRDVDEKYREQIHDLMTQNTDLRRQYMKKCRDLFDEKTDNDFSMSLRIKEAKSTMEAVINARSRADVSLAPCDPEADTMPRIPVQRPLSAPHTRGEEIRAQRQAGETGHINRNKGLYDKPKGRKKLAD